LRWNTAKQEIAGEKMIVTNRWKYGCPKGHINIRTLRQGKHAKMIFCKTCQKWYAEKVLRTEGKHGEGKI